VQRLRPAALTAGCQITRFGEGETRHLPPLYDRRIARQSAFVREAERGELVMAERVVLVRFGNPVPGREAAAAAVAQQSRVAWDKLLADGVIEGYLPVLLDPHGSDLTGFILGWGDAEKLARLPLNPEWQQLSLAASSTMQRFGIVGGTTGESYYSRSEAYAAACAAAKA
jgi:hypothetical protein